MAEIGYFFQIFNLTSRDTGTVHELFVLAVGRLNTNLNVGQVFA